VHTGGTSTVHTGGTSTVHTGGTSTVHTGGEPAAETAGEGTRPGRLRHIRFGGGGPTCGVTRGMGDVHWRVVLALAGIALARRRRI
jgi:hypothetical protein